VPFDYLLTGYLRVGETLGVSIFEASSFPHITYKEIGPGPESNNVHRMLMKNLYTEFPDLYQLSPIEKSALEDYRWPDRTVTLALPYGVGVRQDSANEHCWR